MRPTPLPRIWSHVTPTGELSSLPCGIDPKAPSEGCRFRAPALRAATTDRTIDFNDEAILRGNNAPSFELLLRAPR